MALLFDSAVVVYGRLACAQPSESLHVQAQARRGTHAQTGRAQSARSRRCCGARRRCS